ncbi:hypothetical protein IE81DRAFT_124393 [Ceraceosorus guamensis]|uniref:Uncharacterized protein n=1 Tax=Ceraceosorus guamensis TaxID=1522189 RepID=A0A316VXW8_9BASI|nr:hypothetical protein IE81DRAFT_124393 [Ceraceosorus guamensis]PWN42476.1 hypothetical protein IE81DRAFT_124393 [Ceraceosorus guamensis]
MNTSTSVDPTTRLPTSTSLLRPILSPASPCPTLYLAPHLRRLSLRHHPLNHNIPLEPSTSFLEALTPFPLSRIPSDMRRFFPLLFALLAVLLALTLAAPHSVIEPRRKHIFDKQNNDNFQSFKDNLHCFAMDGPTWVMEDWAQFFDWANTTMTGKPPPLPLDVGVLAGQADGGVVRERFVLI